MQSRETSAGPGWNIGSFRYDAYALISILAMGSLISVALFWLAPTVANWDLMTFYLPWYQLVGESVRSGEVPGWNPHLFSGIPLAGDPQSGWWYAPAMAFFALFPPLLALKLYLAWHVLAMGVLAYIFARLTGLSVIGGIAVALAYAFMQNLGAATCCAIHMQLSPWIPLGLIGIELAARQSALAPRLLTLSISSIAIAQLAAAWVGQGALIGSILIGCYLFWRTVCLPGPEDVARSWLGRCGRFALEALWMFGVGLGLAAAGLLIRLDAASRSFVGSDSYQRVDSPTVGWSSERWFYAVLDFKSYWFGYYLGGAAIIGIAFGFLLLPRQRSFIFFGLVTVIGLAIPLQSTPLREVFFLIPMFESLYAHDPGRMMAVAPIGVAMLIGLTVDQRHALMTGRIRWVALSVIGAATLVIVWLDAFDPAWRPALITLAAGISFLAGLAMFSRFPLESLGRRAMIGRAGVGLMLLALLADPAGRAVLAGLQGDDDAMWQTAIETTVGERDDAGTAAAIAALRDRYPEPWRFAGYLAPPTTWWQGHEHYFEPWVLAAVANNRAAIIGEYDNQGYNPAQLVQYQRAMAVMNGFEREYHESLLYGPGLVSQILDMLNTRFIIVPKPIPIEQTDVGLIIDGYPATGFQIVAESHAAVIVENLEYLPRAWLVHDVVQRSADDALIAFGSGLIDPRTTATIEMPSDISLNPNDGGGTAMVTDYQANHVEIVTMSDGPAFLLLGDVHDPGWRVTIDAGPAQLHRANGLIRGVFVPAGEHTVRFEYRPPELRIGLAISSTSMLTIALLAGWTLFRPRRNSHQPNRAPPTPRL